MSDVGLRQLCWIRAAALPGVAALVRLGARSRAEVVGRAARAGLIAPDP